MKQIQYLIICFLNIYLANVVNAQQISFDQPRGFYSSTIQLTITTDLAGATLKYTLDGSEPNEINGLVFSSAINIDSTVVVRATAYNSIDTIFENNTYLYLADILTQVDSLPGYPGGCEMDPDVVNDPLYSSMMEDVMKRIPTLSVSLSQYDFNNDTAGIYTNPQERGTDWERKASLELIDTDGSTVFSETAGLRIHGGASRRRAKKTFRVLFKDEFGAKKLEYPLFGEQANNEIDGLVLRSRGGTSWVHGNEDHHNWAQYYRDQCANDLYREMGHVTSHGQKAHLYINGIYWGLYNIIEYLHDDFHAAYFGGDKDEYDVINHSGVEYGDSVNWYHIQNLADLGFTNQAELDSIEKYLDINNLFDYCILNQYSGNIDWDHNNWYASRRKTQEGKWRFFPWDSEQFFKLVERNILEKNDTLKPSFLFNALIAHPDMLQKYNDQVQCLCYDEGVLTPAKIDSMWMDGYGKFDIAVIGESARWGDLHRPDTAYTFYNEYLTEQARLQNDYFPARRDTFINQLIEEGWKNSISAAVFNNNGGQIDNNFQCTISNPNAIGDIYLTTDGTDPRLPGGSLNPAAQLYNGAFPISDVTIVSARIFNGIDWSPMCPKIYFPVQNYSDIVINEIHYNPQDSIITAINDTIDGDEYEFIEIHNKGNQPVNLSHVAFKVGVLYDFAIGTILQADEYFVIAEDSLDFFDKYGFYPDAVYVGKASNGGEAIKLFDPFQNVIDIVNYDDKAPWNDVPDGSGYSLALKPIETNNNIATAWTTQASQVTPKALNDFCFPISHTAFNIDASCFGSSNGSVIFTPSGGTAPYSYNWSNGNNNQYLSNVAAGTYSITLTDFYGCNYNKSFVINEPTEISFSHSTIDLLCSGVSTGAAQLTVSGGTPNYSFAWSDGSTNQNLTNAAAGIYTVDITDTNSCLKTETVIINEPSEISFSHSTTDLLCAGASTGAAQLTVFGGTPNYSFAWSDGSINQNLTSAAAGTYTVDITDTNNCLKTETVIINEPSPILLSHLHVDETIAGENDGVINLAVTGGTPPYSYVWSHGPNYQDVNNLAAGTYAVTVTDNNNCNENYSVTIAPGIAACNVPSGILASNIQNTSATLSWTAEQNVNEYDVEYRAQGTFTWISFSSNFSFAILNNLVACTEYEVRIKANCPVTQISSYSNIYTFETSGCIAPCSTINGLFSQNVTTSSAFLVWDIVPNATYTMYYRAVGNANWFSYPSQFPIAILFTLPNCTDFEWYVEVNCTNGQISNASPIANFTTVGAACKTNNNAQNISNENIFEDVLIYPNPTNDIINISFTTQINVESKLNIYNVVGQLMITQKIIQFENNNQISINVNALEAGNYFINLESKQGTKYYKFIKE